MKTITLINGPVKTIDVIHAVVTAAPQGRGLTLVELRARCRILDVLDTLKADSLALALEDSDYATLKDALDSFQFGMASKELLRVVDGVLTPE